MTALRLFDEEWLLRACVLMNRDLPPGVPEYNPDTVLNQAYSTLADDFYKLMDLIDPEGEIDLVALPVHAHFRPSVGWPVDLVVAAALAVPVWMFMPNFAGVGRFVAFTALAAYVGVQFLRARRRVQISREAVRERGFDPDKVYPLKLRDLVAYRRVTHTLH